MLRFFSPLEGENTKQVISDYCEGGVISIITKILSDMDAARFATTCKTIRRQSFPVRHARFSARTHA